MGPRKRRMANLSSVLNMFSYLTLLNLNMINLMKSDSWYILSLWCAWTDRSPNLLFATYFICKWKC